MSASNWANCDRCYQEDLRAWEEKKTEAEESYGKVPREEHTEMMEAIGKKPSENEELREDYEVYIAGDVFTVSYGASCWKCGISYEYKRKVPLKNMRVETPKHVLERIERGSE